MRQINGRHGDVYAVGSPYTFVDLPLEDCGDGFDWRASDRSLGYWLPDHPAAFCFQELDVWKQIEPVEIHRGMGRVGFGRCLRGFQVRASGTCLPLARIASLDGWELHVEMVFEENQALGSETRSISARMKSASALLKGVRADPQEVVVRLSPTESGSFVGVGSVISDARKTIVKFNEEGVRFEPC